MIFIIKVTKLYMPANFNGTKYTIRVKNFIISLWPVFFIVDKKMSNYFLLYYNTFLVVKLL